MTLGRRFSCSPTFIHVQSKAALLENEYDLYIKADMFINLIWASCAGRRFIASRNGRLGLVPPYTQVGDLIFVALGGGNPLLIRPVQNLERKEVEYHFVGTCYVHGIMDGEALRMDLDEDEVILI